MRVAGLDGKAEKDFDFDRVLSISDGQSTVREGGWQSDGGHPAGLN